MSTVLHIIWEHIYAEWDAQYLAARARELVAEGFGEVQS